MAVSHKVIMACITPLSLPPSSFPLFAILFEVIYDTSGSQRWLVTRQRLYCLLLRVCVCVCVFKGVSSFTPLLKSLSFSLSPSVFGVIIFVLSVIDHSQAFFSIPVSLCVHVWICECWQCKCPVRRGSCRIFSFLLHTHLATDNLPDRWAEFEIVCECKSKMEDIIL